jgi:hypothetical protein
MKEDRRTDKNSISEEKIKLLIEKFIGLYPNHIL